MLSTKSIQRLYKPSRLRTLPANRKLQSLASSTKEAEKSPNDTNLSRDQVIEIYDWISQLNA